MREEKSVSDRYVIEGSGRNPGKGGTDNRERRSLYLQGIEIKKIIKWNYHTEDGC